MPTARRDVLFAIRILLPLTLAISCVERGKDSSAADTPVTHAPDSISPKWFGDLDVKVVGALPADSAKKVLIAVGDTLRADESIVGVQPMNFDFRRRGPKPYQHTGHAFGFIEPIPSGGPKQGPIVQVGNMKADETLRNARLRITLDRMRVADYPGKGIHRVLFDFYAQNQGDDGRVDHLHFNTTYRAQEAEQVGVIGYPIFVGLRPGSEGVAFKAFTVNVENDSDQGFLNFLESDVVKEGLRLTKAAQPALAPLANIAVGITTSIANRNKNIAVQDFYMGLDFSNVPTRARLREGSYVAIQIPQTNVAIWKWDDWVFDRDSGEIVSKSDSKTLIPYNYVVFSVSRMAEANGGSGNP